MRLLVIRLGDEAQTKRWILWAQWPPFEVRTADNDAQDAFTRWHVCEDRIVPTSDLYVGFKSK